jgi:D-alanyl-D-alanine carboxypeptidase
MIRYDMPGDAAWLGTFGDWRMAKRAFDQGQAEVATLGFSHLGREWILPVVGDKVKKQAAIIADLEPEAAQSLCASYQAKRQFCQVRKAQDIKAPFSGFWR